MDHIHSLEEIQTIIKKNSLVLLYISRENCSVCHSLLPQIEQVLKDFPSIRALHIDADVVPKIAGEYTVFTVPAVLVFIKGKEMIRKARFIPIEPFRQELARLLSLMDEADT